MFCSIIPMLPHSFNGRIVSHVLDTETDNTKVAAKEILDVVTSFYRSKQMIDEDMKAVEELATQTAQRLVKEGKISRFEVMKGVDAILFAPIIGIRLYQNDYDISNRYRHVGHTVRLSLEQMKTKTQLMFMGKHETEHTFVQITATNLPVEQQEALDKFIETLKVPRANLLTSERLHSELE